MVFYPARDRAKHLGPAQVGERERERKRARETEREHETDRLREIV